MKTLSACRLPKHTISKWPKVEKTFLQRLFAFLLRDVVPSVILLIIVSFCTLLIAGKIDQAKQSRINTVVKAESFN